MKAVFLLKLLFLETINLFSTKEIFQIAIKNLIEKYGKIQYLDLFAIDDTLRASAYKNIKTLGTSINSLTQINNAEEIFYECQRIKTHCLI